MAHDFPGTQEPRLRPASGTATIDVDLGLRQHMLQVYNLMAAGLGLTGLVAYAAVTTGFYRQTAGTPLNDT